MDICLHAICFKEIPIMSCSCKAIVRRTGKVCKRSVKEDTEFCGYHKNNTSVDEQDDCVICLSCIDKHHQISITPCKHVFHKKCIDKWKKKANTCPLCRNTLFVKDTVHQDIRDTLIRFQNELRETIRRGETILTQIDALQLTSIENRARRQELLAELRLHNEVASIARNRHFIFIREHFSENFQQFNST